MRPGDPASDFKLTLLSRNPAWIMQGEQCGLERIGIDIERIGKHGRQRALRAPWISDHRLEDLAVLAPLVRHARLFVRLNPIHPATATEIESALAGGARSLMLPQFSEPREVEQFIRLVGGRAECLLLLETPGALARIDDILAVPGIDELMVGLNDLSLSLRLRHPLELAASPLLDFIAGRARAAGVAFGFGGVADPSRDSGLPVPADLLLARYAEVEARSAWLSRSFFRDLTPANFPASLANLRHRLTHWRTCSPEERSLAAGRFRAAVQAMIHAEGSRP